MAPQAASQLNGDGPFSGGRLNTHSRKESWESEIERSGERDLEGRTDSAV